jgi:hypothetical protein
VRRFIKAGMTVVEDSHRVVLIKKLVTKVSHLQITDNLFHVQKTVV